MRTGFLSAAWTRRQRVLWFSPQQGDEVLDALCKFHDFTTSMEFELDFIIPCRSMINGLFKADERVYHFARQNEADPHTKYERESRHNAQAPLSTMNQLAGFLVIQLDAPPIALFQLGRELQGPFT
jgi:hypothetical protein